MCKESGEGEREGGEGGGGRKTGGEGRWGGGQKDTEREREIIFSELY